MSVRSWFKRHGRAKSSSASSKQSIPSTTGPPGQPLAKTLQGNSAMEPSAHKADLQDKDGPTAEVSDGSNRAFLEQLWNDAYDALKQSESELVDAYEKILTGYLREPDSISKDPSAEENDIGPSRSQRRSQMEKLVHTGLKRTDNKLAATQKVDDSIQVINSVRGIIEKSVRVSPEATVAWAGVSLAIEIVMNPVSEALINRQAINFVFDRMELYWDLHSLLLDENRAATATANLRSQLERFIGKLYQQMLHIQMKSICAYSSGTFKRLRRDLFKLDDWGSQIQSMRDAENEVDKCSQQFNTEEARSHQKLLLNKLDGIHLALVKGYEQQEIFHKTQEDRNCLRDLYITDPASDKKRIESTKGGLLQDAYYWVITHPDFQNWRNVPESSLLWIKGDPGKGKTMLLCGIIDELKKSKSATGSLSFFFCQQTDSRLNNATAVLRGLIHSLAIQQPHLTKHIRSRYDNTGKSLFEDANACVAMIDILTEMLHSPDLTRATLIIDALDECPADLPRLLEFLTRQISGPCPVKWIVSSRNIPSIEGPFKLATRIVQLSLELNQESASQAIQAYIQHKVDWLGQVKGYDQFLSEEVRTHLVENAEGTFLWVGLVCHELGKETVTRRSTRHKLKQFPPGLNPLYDRMLQQINQSDDAEFCKRLLAIMSVAYRPLAIEELFVLDQSFEDGFQDLRDLEDVIGNCGSFVVTREGSVYFVHQSAKEFVLRTAAILPSGGKKEHYNVALRSLQLLNRALRRNIYNLDQETLAGDIIMPKPDPLSHVAYSCLEWMFHLTEGMRLQEEQSDEVVPVSTLTSFMAEHFLHWLEAISVLGGTLRIIYGMLRLERHIQVSTAPQELKDLIYDASRFTRYFKEGIEKRPLQTYSSGLVFSPSKSKIRGLYQKDEPSWVTKKPEVASDWDACLQTIEGQASVTAVAFAPYGTQFATASQDGTIKVWHAVAGAPLYTFEGHDYFINPVAMTSSFQVVSTSSDHEIKIWDMESGTCVQKLVGHSDYISSISLESRKGLEMASASLDKTIKIWDTITGACLRTLEGHTDAVRSVSFVRDGSRLASASSDKTVKIWDATTGACLYTLQGHSDEVLSVAYAPNGLQLASSSDWTIRIWCAKTGACQQVITDHTNIIKSVSFAPDSRKIVSASSDTTVRIWDAETGQCQGILTGHSSIVHAAVFSPDGGQIVSGSYDRTIKIWDTGKILSYNQKQASHSERVSFVTLAPNRVLAASSSKDGAIMIWDIATRACLHTLKHGIFIWEVAFAPDSRHLVSGSHDKRLKIWDTTTGTCLKTLKGHSERIYGVAFSPDSRLVVSGSLDHTIRVWDVLTGICTLSILDGYSQCVDKVAFSSDGNQVVSMSRDKIIKIWDLATGACLQTLERDSNENVRFFRKVQSRYGLSRDRAWITCDGREILWLPTNFRPRISRTSSIVGETFVCTTPAGEICVMEFE